MKDLEPKVGRKIGTDKNHHDMCEEIYNILPVRYSAIDEDYVICEPGSATHTAVIYRDGIDPKALIFTRYCDCSILIDMISDIGE